MSPRVPPQWVDSEVDVKVKLKALGFGVCVFYLRGNVLRPQFKEHFWISIIKGTKKVFLEKTVTKDSCWEKVREREQWCFLMATRFTYHTMITNEHAEKGPVTIKINK